jgi:hypothetical protein
MPADFVLKALNYGVVGLGAVMIIAAWRILVREQAREGQPRKGILRFTALFMMFCVFVMLAGTFVQIHKEAASANGEKQLQPVKEELRAMHSYLCDKAFNELRNVDPNLRESTLEHSIQALDESMQRAWQDSGGEANEMRPCRQY